MGLTQARPNNNNNNIIWIASAVLAIIPSENLERQIYIEKMSIAISHKPNQGFIEDFLAGGGGGGGGGGNSCSYIVPSHSMPNIGSHYHPKQDF